MIDADAGTASPGGSVEARRVGFALTRYRERYRVALAALAEWSAIPVDRLVTFEGGLELPTRGELEALANAFTRVGEGPPVDVRALHLELLGFAGYPHAPSVPLWSRAEALASALLHASTARVGVGSEPSGSGRGARQRGLP